MTGSPNGPTLADVLDEIRGIRSDIERLDHRLSEEVEFSSKRWQEQEIQNRDVLIRIDVVTERIDAYQKASTQVVNLAFALVGAATVALIGIVLRLAVTV
jgi:hypothetical protein